jgi:hypothetical protein
MALICGLLRSLSTRGVQLDMVGTAPLSRPMCQFGVGESTETWRVAGLESSRYFKIDRLDGVRAQFRVGNRW